MSYLLRRTFTNGAKGESFKAGRTLTSLPWLTVRQIQSCIDEGSLELVGEAPVVVPPDDLTLLDKIDAHWAVLLNARGIATFADIIANDITFLPRVGPTTADAIKRQAKEFINAT